jgi:hypothetical protein
MFIKEEDKLWNEVKVSARVSGRSVYQLLNTVSASSVSAAQYCFSWLNKVVCCIEEIQFYLHLLQTLKQSWN